MHVVWFERVSPDLEHSSDSIPSYPERCLVSILVGALVLKLSTQP